MTACQLCGGPKTAGLIICPICRFAVPPGGPEHVVPQQADADPRVQAAAEAAGLAASRTFDAVSPASHTAASGIVHLGTREDCDACRLSLNGLRQLVKDTFDDDQTIVGYQWPSRSAPLTNLSMAYLQGGGLLPASAPPVSSVTLNPTTDEVAAAKAIVRALSGLEHEPEHRECADCEMELDGDGPCPFCNREEVDRYAIGFRAWKPRSGLVAAYQPTTWQPGPMRADCASCRVWRPDLGPPCLSHGSGWHGWWKPEWPKIRTYGGGLFTVVGAFRAWGTVIDHGTDGFRSEYAELIGLLDDCEEAAPLAAAYGLPPLGHSALLERCREFGELGP